MDTNAHRTKGSVSGYLISFTNGIGIAHKNKSAIKIWRIKMKDRYTPCEIPCDFKTLLEYTKTQANKATRKTPVQRMLKMAFTASIIFKGAPVK